MRNVLNHTEEAFIPLAEEINIINTYCELESLRFDFDYEIALSPELDIYNIEIPGMILQPHVENAVIHGLSHGEQGRKLQVRIGKQSNYVVCEIEDNGIGIHESMANKNLDTLRHKSLGIRLTQERLAADRRTIRTRDPNRNFG